MEQRTPLHSSSSEPSIGLALGGGGARGLAHIVILEAFDELGIRPMAIAGTSIGALYATGYASGLSGAELREHTLETLKPSFALIRDLFAARAKPFQRGGAFFTPRSALLDPEAVLEIIMPKQTAQSFADVAIPLQVVASDYYAQDPVVIADGPLFHAVAASMALPVIFHPVVSGDRVLIDGGLTNPLPFDVISQKTDIVVAVDVSGMPVVNPLRDAPTALEALFASAFLFERSIVREKLKVSQPNILIHGGTGEFQVLDFLKCREILAAAEPAKDKLKRQLDRVMTNHAMAAVEPPQTN